MSRRFVAVLLASCVAAVGVVFARKKIGRSIKRKSNMGSVLSYLVSLFTCDKSSSKPSPSESLGDLTSEEKGPESPPVPSQKNGPSVDSFLIRWRGSEREVFVSGSFDGWTDLVQLEKTDQDLFSVRLALVSVGRVEFKFVVDGKWICSDDYPKCDNGLGGYNNFIDLY